MMEWLRSSATNSDLLIALTLPLILIWIVHNDSRISRRKIDALERKLVELKYSVNADRKVPEDESLSTAIHAENVGDTDGANV